MDGPVEPGGGEHYDRNIEPRLSGVEHDVRDLKDTLAELKTMVARMDARLDAVLPHLATKADLANVETRLGAMDGRLSAMDVRLGAMDGRLCAMDGRLGAMDGRLGAIDGGLGAMDGRLGAMDGRLGAMDARLDATLPHLATRADLAEKPSKTYMWGILAVLLTAYACGLAALAVLK